MSQSEVASLAPALVQEARVGEGVTTKRGDARGNMSIVLCFSCQAVCVVLYIVLDILFISKSNLIN